MFLGHVFGMRGQVMGFSLSEGDSRVCGWERSQGRLGHLSWLWGELGMGKKDGCT